MSTPATPSSSSGPASPGGAPASPPRPTSSSTSPVPPGHFWPLVQPGAARLLAANPGTAARVDDPERAERRPPSRPCAGGQRPGRRSPAAPPASQRRLASEDPLRFELVVCPAEHPDAVDCRLAAPRHRHHMVELEEAGLLAAPAVLGDERAARTVSRHHLTPHRARHVAPGRALLRRPRSPRLAELPPLDPVE